MRKGKVLKEEEFIVCEECGNRLKGVYYIRKKANTDLNKILCSFCLYENYLKRK